MVFFLMMLVNVMLMLIIEVRSQQIIIICARLFKKNCIYRKHVIYASNKVLCDHFT